MGIKKEIVASRSSRCRARRFLRVWRRSLCSRRKPREFSVVVVVVEEEV